MSASASDLGDNFYRNEMWEYYYVVWHNRELSVAEFIARVDSNPKKIYAGLEMLAKIGAIKMEPYLLDALQRVKQEVEGDRTLTSDLDKRRKLFKAAVRTGGPLVKDCIRASRRFESVLG